MGGRERENKQGEAQGIFQHPTANNPHPIFIVTFSSTHNALKAEKALKEKDAPFTLMPTPKKLAAFCSLSILFEEKDRLLIEDILRKSKVKTAAIYKKGEDDYVEV